MSKSRRRESIVRLQKSRYGHRIGALWQHDVSTLYGFFQAAARRSKRGYRGKLHRCNDAGEAARVLSRDLSAMNDNGAITGMDAREDGVYITYVPADGADPVSKKLGSNGITYLGDMPYTCTQDYGDCTLLTFCHQKTATQNVTIKNLNGSYNIKQIVPAHIGGVLCFLAIVDVTNLNKGATIDTESSDTKRVFII